MKNKKYLAVDTLTTGLFVSFHKPSGAYETADPGAWAVKILIIA